MPVVTEEQLKMESQLLEVKANSLKSDREYLVAQRALLEIEEAFVDKLWEVQQNEAALTTMEKNALRGQTNQEFGIKIEAQKLIVHKAKMTQHNQKTGRQCLEAEIRILSVQTGLVPPKRPKKKNKKNKKKDQSPLMTGTFAQGANNTTSPGDGPEKMIYTNTGDDALDEMDQEDPELGNKMIKVL